MQILAVNQLLSLADDLDLEEEDISSFFEPAPTAFSKLFQEQEKMKVGKNYLLNEPEWYWSRSHDRLHLVRCLPASL